MSHWSFNVSLYHDTSTSEVWKETTTYETNGPAPNREIHQVLQYVDRSDN